MKAKHDQIADEINAALNINIYENKRTTPVVDGRALFCYILKKDLDYTLYNIRDLFRKNGKKFDHSTVHYNTLLFEEVRNRRKDINELREVILNGISPKYILLKQIREIESIDEINNLINCITQTQNERIERN